MMMRNICEGIVGLSLDEGQAFGVPDGKDKSKINYVSFKDLWRQSRYLLQLLERTTLKKGDKVLLFVRPSEVLPPLLFAFFAKNLVPVIIDPGMGPRKLLRAVREVEPEGLVGEPISLLLKWLSPGSFKKLKWSASTRFLKQHLNTITEHQFIAPYTPVPLREKDVVAINYTSGGTGRPKGVVYTQKIFSTQVELLNDMFKLRGRDGHLAGFALFGMFTLCLGVRTVFPAMNPSKPAKVNASLLYQTIDREKLDFLTGSPAIWERLYEYMRGEEGKALGKLPPTLHGVRVLATFGAPIDYAFHEKMYEVFPEVETYAPYGATEALPLAYERGRELSFQMKRWEKSTQGALPLPGVLVGRAVKGAQIQIIPLVDGPLNALPEQLGVYELGEILVKGPMVSQNYFKLPEADELAKIVKESRGEDREIVVDVYHRMGDVGYLDEEGKLWFCGRKAYMVDHLPSIPVELYFNRMEGVLRTALVRSAVGPLLAVQWETPLKEMDKGERKRKLALLSERAKLKDWALDIAAFVDVESFPVDIRHNIKIDRLKLGQLMNRRRKEFYLSPSSEKEIKETEVSL